MICGCTVSGVLRLMRERLARFCIRHPEQASMSDEVILPAYVDETGARGLMRDLKPERDQDISLMCALVFEPDGHAKAIETFTAGFDAFCRAMPPGAKLHITDAFKPGNETWGNVAARVREEFIEHVKTLRPIVVYSARRLKLAREAHARDQTLIEAGKAAKRSAIKITGANRPSDARVEDDLVICLSLRLDAFAGDMVSQIRNVKQVDLLFDEIDVAERYEALIQRTREISKTVTKVSGWDPAQSKRVKGSIQFAAEAPFRLDTRFIGNIHVLGKAHPLILAADIVTNYLVYHLKQLPSDAPLNAPSSIVGWVLEDRVWGVSDDATDDLY
jgi:hypothetical protein